MRRHFYVTHFKEGIKSGQTQSEWLSPLSYFYTIVIHEFTIPLLKRKGKENSLI